MSHGAQNLVLDEGDEGNGQSYIYHKPAKQTLKLKEDRGVYVLDMWVAPPGHMGEAKRIA